MKKYLLFLLLCCTSILVTAQPVNDNAAGATTILHSSNNCSANAAYTTINATADGLKGSCWENGPNYTVWFKFVATTTNVTLDLKVGGVEGTMQHPNMALWQNNTVTEIKCVRRIDATTDVQISSSALVIGNTYYISVDNYVGLSYRGTFTLCIDDQATYDEIVGAKTIAHTSNNCSANAAYSTVHATPDGLIGSCWENGPNYTRWFKFVATTTNVTLDLKVGGAEGTMQHPNMALWQSDAATEIKCVRRIDATTDVQISSSALVIGNTYYISVDNYVGLSYRGTFTLCIDDQPTYDEIAGAKTIVHTSNNCSANAAYSTIHATPDGLIGSCWENGPNYTRWFKFVATTTNVTLDLKVGGAEGTMQHPNMALWQSNAVTEVECVRRLNATADVQISSSGLVIGNTYYISVDNYVGLSYRGTFTLCIDDQPTYDEIVGAKTLIHTSNNCSLDGQYTTINATADGLKGSCWENGPNYTRWFKFVATTTNVTLDLKVGGAEGTMQHPNMALWQSNATTQIACVRRIDATTDVQLSSSSLIIGNTYYVSVDNYVGLSYRGTFTLCIDNQPTYDEIAGAKILTNLNNWCSADGQYTTINATADGLKGTCWENGPNYTRWFKFVAVSPNVTLQMKVGGAEGTLQHPNIALWQSNATTQVGCTRRVNATTDITLSSAALVVGNTYYVSCDNYVGLSYRGTFTLCIDNIDKDYYSIADGNWANGNNWSIIGHGGLAAGTYPDAGDVAHIKRNTINVTGNEICAEVNLGDSIATTKLEITSGSLIVSGQVNIKNLGSNFDSWINVTGGTSLYVNDNFTATRGGGNNLFYLNIDNNSSMTVNQDFEWISSGGTTNNNTVTLNGNASLTVNQDFKLTNTGGIKTLVQLNNTSRLNVVRDVNLSATADNKVELELNNTSVLTIGRSAKRGTPAYGILTSNNTSSVVYNGSMYSQIVAAGGSGTGDIFQYQNLIFNNTHITVPQFTLQGGNLSVPSQFSLTDGVVLTSSSNLLILENTSTTVGGSLNSYVDGPLRKIGNTAYTFHLGDGVTYAPVTLSAPSLATDHFTAEYFKVNPDLLYNILSKDITLDHISSCEYWIIDRTRGNSNVNVTLGWDTRSCGVTNLADLRVARWDGATWKDHGNGGTTGNTSAGTIITAGVVSSFSPFTLASSTINNPLPIELISFTAKVNNNEVDLKWVTASEINNAYFNIERSLDGVSWESILTIDGAGNSNQLINYQTVDESPKQGVSYYRLKQTDFNGDFSYSNVEVVNFSNNEFANGIKVYPNPVNSGEIIKVELENINVSGLVIEVQDITGRKVYSKKFNNLNENQLVLIPLNIEIPKGLYLITVTNNQQVFGQKLIVR